MTDGFGHFFAGLFSRPRLTWAALAISAAAFLTLQRFGALEITGSLDQTAKLAAWTVLILGSTFFVLILVIDVSNFAQRSIQTKATESKARERFFSASEPTRAILSYMAVNCENSMWVMNDYVGLHDFITRRFGYVSAKSGRAIEIEVHSSDFDWLRNNLHWLSGQDVGESVRPSLFQSMDNARVELANSRA